MNTLTKADAIRNIAEKTGLKKYAVKIAVESLLYEIKEALSRGERVEFRGFGVWKVKLGKSRMGRNPSNPSSRGIPIPARPSLRFKQSDQLKAAVRANKTVLTETEPTPYHHA